MTRDEAMLKLLALEPERFDRLVHITGWGREETREVLQRLQRMGLTSSISCQGQGDDYRRHYVPGMHDVAIQLLLAERENCAQRGVRNRRGAVGRAVANARRLQASTPTRSTTRRSRNAVRTA